MVSMDAIIKKIDGLMLRKGTSFLLKCFIFPVLENSCIVSNEWLIKNSAPYNSATDSMHNT